MESKQLTKEELGVSLKKIMHFETDEIFNKVLLGLASGRSVLVDAIAYIGNGRYVKRTLKKRYKYKLITPILDNQNNLYSTDLYEGGAENALKGPYGIYVCTRQMCIDFITTVDTDYSVDRFDFGYKDGKYGTYKLIIK